MALVMLKKCSWLKAAADFSLAVPRSPTRRLEGSGLCLSGMQIVKTTDVLFFAINRHFSSPWKPTQKVASSVDVALQERRMNALVKSARQLSRRHESRWELPVTPRTRFIQIEREKCFAAEDFLFSSPPRSKRQAAQRQSASLGYYVNI